MIHVHSDHFCDWHQTVPTRVWIILMKSTEDNPDSKYNFWFIWSFLRPTAEISDLNKHFIYVVISLPIEDNSDTEKLWLFWLFLWPTTESSDSNINSIDEVDKRQFRHLMYFPIQMDISTTDADSSDLNINYIYEVDRRQFPLPSGRHKTYPTLTVFCRSNKWENEETFISVGIICWRQRIDHIKSTSITVGIVFYRPEDWHNEVIYIRVGIVCCRPINWSN